MHPQTPLTHPCYTRRPVFGAQEGQPSRVP